MSARLLVTSVGRRTYVVEELLRSAGEDCLLYVADDNGLSPAMHADGATPVPSRQGIDRVEWLRSLRQEFGITAVMSLHDYDIAELSRVSTELDDLGVRFIGPSFSTVEVCLDKLLLHEHLMTHAPDLAVPTYMADAPIEDDSCKYVLKDRYGSGSSGLRIVSRDIDRVRHVEASGSRHVWTPSGFRPAEIVRQDLADGVEFNVDLFYSAEGRIVGHCVKQKLAMRAGETDSARVYASGFDWLVSRLADAFASLHFVGNVDVDVFVGDLGATVIDVNPRFGGGYAFSAIAGYQAGDGVWAISGGLDIDRYLVPARALHASKTIGVAELIPSRLGATIC